MFPIIVGGLVVGVAINLAAEKPHDWLMTPMQKWKERPGNADISINYAPSLAPFITNVENPYRHTTSETNRRQALKLNATFSNDPAYRSMAVHDVLLNNRRWGSGNMGLSGNYANV